MCSYPLDGRNGHIRVHKWPRCRACTPYVQLYVLHLEFDACLTYWCAYVCGFCTASWSCFYAAQTQTLPYFTDDQFNAMLFNGYPPPLVSELWRVRALYVPLASRTPVDTTHGTSLHVRALV